MLKPEQKFETRIAEARDAEVIAQLGQTTFTETFGHHFRDPQDLLDYYDATFSPEKIAKSISKTNNIFWISFVNDLPVGYAKLKLHSKSEFLTSENTCQLQKIYVLKDFLAIKIGTELQNQLIAKASELNFEKIWLSVLESNERAIHFYQKNDFATIGNHSFQIGKEKFEFLVMAKSLE
jgi:ribosomal protein S18 acetylase RimI-like enzyme